jgi:hypothetical protein
MIIVKNMLLKWLDDPENPMVERVLYVNSSSDEIVVIDVDDHKALPELRSLEVVNQGIEACVLIPLKASARAPRVFSESELETDRYKIYKEKRDKAYSVIAPLVEGGNAIRMFNRRERAHLIAERAAAIGMSAATIYCYMRRWWQWGQSLNTLLPHYLNAGRRLDGKPKKIGKYKRGRPSLITLNDEQKRPTGVNVDTKWLEIIKAGGEKFYEHRKQPSFSKAYRKILRFFCPKATIQVGSKEIIILPDPNKNEVFTLEQFKYHYLQHQSKHPEQAVTKRKGERDFNLNYRALVGNAKTQYSHPGALYQIDATIADVYLVSSFNSTDIIGRPVIYAIIDSFSRMIVGLCVRLEGEGWLGVKLALENVVAEKIAFCERYGISITNELWPACYMPEEITGDRGPLKSKHADNIPKALNVTVSNCGPGRADWKGIIEQLFRLMNIRVIHDLPGAVDPNYKRGDIDYRLTSALTIHDITELMISTAIHHNTKNRMNWYPMDKDMIADGVEPFPVELYWWGVKNRAGSLNDTDFETVRVNLLPEREASVTEFGIQAGAHDQFYTCDLFEKSWRFLARNKGRWTIRVAFDPRMTDTIYYRPGNGSPSITCYLKDPDSPYKGKDWQEVNELIKQRKLAESHYRPIRAQADSELDADAERVAERGRKRKLNNSANSPKLSKQAKLSNIAGNRQMERKSMQKAEAQQLRSNAGVSNSNGIAPTDDAAEENYVPIPQPSNVRDIRRMKMKDEENDK